MSKRSLHSASFHVGNGRHEINIRVNANGMVFIQPVTGGEGVRTRPNDWKDVVDEVERLKAFFLNVGVSTQAEEKTDV